MWTPTRFVTKSIQQRNQPNYLTSTPILDTADWRRMSGRRTLAGGYDALTPLKQDQDIKSAVSELSTKGACWTVLNIYVGIGLLSKPYAISKGGWASLVLLCLFAILANASAKQLVSCFKSPRCVFARSYAQVVDEVLGFWGAIVLIVFVMLELLAAVCISLLFIWANLEKLLPWAERWAIIVFSTVACVPTIWLIKFSDASYLTLLGFFSTLLIIFSLVFVRAFYGEVEEVDMENFFGPNIPLSMGIFVLSFAGHASLPQVYREMKKPEEFDRMLDVCFSIMFVIYAGAGVVGYLIYGHAANIIISTNLVDCPGGVLAKVTAGFIIAKNYLTLNPLMAVLCDSTEVMMGIDELRHIQRMYRIGIFLLAAVLAFLARDAIPFLEGLTGAICTMITTFILPSILFGSLYKKTCSTGSKATSFLLFIFGVVMMILLTFGAIMSLVHPDPEPNTI